MSWSAIAVNLAHVSSLNTIGGEVINLAVWPAVVYMQVLYSLRHNLD